MALTVSTVPEHGPLLALDVGVIVVLDGVSQGELLPQVVTDLRLLPGGQRCIEGLTTLSNSWTHTVTRSLGEMATYAHMHTVTHHA